MEKYNVVNVITLLYKLYRRKDISLAREVIEALEIYEIPVVSLTSDGVKPNRCLYQMCQQQQEKGEPKCVPYKTINTFKEEEELSLSVMYHIF